jgi:hypothetical protein
MLGKAGSRGVPVLDEDGPGVLLSDGRTRRGRD